MFFGIRFRPEGGLIQGIQNVPDVQPVLARYCFDVAVVTNRPEMELFKDFRSLGMLLFHIPDDRVAADQLIESKHWVAPPSHKLVHPVYQSFSPLLSAC